MKKDRYFIYRFICYIAGLFIMSVGSNLFIKSALGVAPSCTIALVLTELFPGTDYAVFNFIVNICLLIAEISVEKKLRIRHAIQLALTLVYSFFIQWTSVPLHLFTVSSMPGRIILSFAACSVLAAGVSCTVSSGFAVLPMEGFVASIAERSKKDFGTIRVYIEVFITGISAVFSILVLQDLSAVGIGTIIAALFTGTVTHFFSFLFRKQFRILSEKY